MSCAGHSIKACRMAKLEPKRTFFDSFESDV
jgi:hypothetical protein